MDKANSRGRPTISKLHFLPLTAVEVQDPQRQAILRRNDLTPYEVIYLGDCGDLGEVFATLSQIYYLPSIYFRPRLEEFAGHPEAQEGDRYLLATNADSRVGRLSADESEKLKDKISAYWNRRLPPDDPLVQSPDISNRSGRVLKATVTRITHFFRRPSV
jgi:hypothetical protein